MATNTKIVQTPAVALYSPISPSAVSAVITPYPKDLDGVKLTMSDFGTLPNATIDPKVSGYEEIVSFTGIVDNGDGTATLTGLTRDLQSKYPYTASGTGKQHGSSAIVVFGNNPQVQSRYTARDNDEVVSGQWTFLTFPITPSTPLATAAAAGMTRLSVAPVNPLIPIAVGVNDTSTFAPITAAIPTGGEMAFAGLNIPASWLLEDGSAVSRTVNAALWAALSKTQVFTVTIASPGVVTSASHGLQIGMRIRLTTTGSLPTGLTTGVDYYIISAGFTSGAFELALAPGGTAINTTGTQSGVHSFVYAPHGHGDGSTTFNLPDRRSRAIIGAGAGTVLAAIISIAGNVITHNADVANNNEFQTGTPVLFTAIVAGNLVTATTYYVVRLSNNTFSLATTLANAQLATPTVITLAGTETGAFGITFSTRTLGDTGGEEGHSQSILEMAGHNHSPITTLNGGSGSATNGSIALAFNNGTAVNPSTLPTNGANAPANIMAPYGVSQYIIKT